MRRTWLIFSQAVTVAVAVLFVVATLKPEWLQRGAASSTPNVVSIIASPTTSAGGAAVPTGVSYAPAAKRAAPAVVSITASKAPARGPRSDDPLFEFFFGGHGQLQREPQIGLGSGVIVAPQEIGRASCRERV